VQNIPEWGIIFPLASFAANFAKMGLLHNSTKPYRNLIKTVLAELWEALWPGTVLFALLRCVGKYTVLTPTPSIKNPSYRSAFSHINHANVANQIKES